MPCKRSKAPRTAPQAAQYCLADFCENPDNPQTVTADAFARLVEKVRRLPEGLKANSIAFVRDDARAGGLCMVIIGNKRLRALKAIYGENGRVPAEWFVDVTGMSEKERREFLVNMNVNEGAWDVEKLMEQYSPDELNAAGGGGQAAPSGGWTNTYDWGDYIG